jgi:transcriptional regulator of arginine metabolism
VIRRILGTQAVRAQEELVRRLRGLGFEVGQASVSRDLREIGAAKIGGVYRIPEAASPVPPEPSPLDLARRLVVSMVPAGPHLLVVRTTVGGASPVGLAVDQAGWREVVGTVAGDDTLFVATPGLRQQAQVIRKLSALAVSNGRSPRQRRQPKR